MDITNQISMVIPEDEDTKKLIESYQNFKVKLDTVMSQTVNNFVVIGYMLKLARDTGVLEQSNYKTLTEFAQAEYGLRPDEVSRFTNINDKFSENGYSPRLDNKYIGYGYSKLSEMLSLPPAVTDQLEPDMSREDIRTIKQEYQEAQEETPIELAMEEMTAKEEEKQIGELPDVYPTDDMEETIYRYFAFDENDNETEAAIARQLFERLNGIDEATDKHILEAIAPNESRFIITRLPGRGRVQLKVYADGRAPLITLLREGLAEELETKALIDYIISLTGAGTGMSAKESWESAYKREYPKATGEAKSEPKAEKKASKVTTTTKPAEKKPEKKEEPKKEESKKEEIAPAQMETEEETKTVPTAYQPSDPVDVREEEKKEETTEETAEEEEPSEETHFISSEEWNRRFDNYYEILGNTFHDVGRHLRAHNFSDAKYAFRELVSTFEKIVTLPQKEDEK